MSTTKQLKVYKGIPTIITARARGYWDDKTVLTFDTAGESKSVSMSVYDGLNCEISDSASGVKVLNFVNTVLPYKWDYNDKLATSKYCLAPSGQSYDVNLYHYNFIKTGEPTIDYTTGVVSGFSTSNYLQISHPFAPVTYTWEIVFKVTTGSDVSGGAAFGNFGGTHQNSPQVGLENGNFAVYMPGSSTNSQQFGVTGTYSVQVNTTYWLKLYFTGTAYCLDYSLDGTNYINDITRSSTTRIFTPSAGFNIGYNYFSSSSGDVWKGSIHLWESYIKINGVLWWEGRSAVIYDNFTVTGEPIVNYYTTGIVNGFSHYNYISLPEIFNPGASTWEQQIKFTTGSSLSYSHQRLTGTPTDMQGGANIVIQSDKLALWLTSTNNSWNIYTGDYPSASILQTNTTYWVKLIFDGSKYVLSYSTDGTSFTDIITVNSSTAVTSTQAMSFGAGSGNNPFYGSIDLSETYINIDGSLWWKAGGKNIESLPGVLYDYTDDGSAVTLDCYANGDTSVILTDDASYNGTYLGTVAIPAHSV